MIGSHSKMICVIKKGPCLILLNRNAKLVHDDAMGGNVRGTYIGALIKHRGTLFKQSSLILTRRRSGSGLCT